MAIVGIVAYKGGRKESVEYILSFCAKYQER